MEIEEAKEVKDKTMPVQLCPGDFPVPERPALPPHPALPLLQRGKGPAVRFACSLAILRAMLAFSPLAMAQTEKQTESAMAPVASSALSHDLSGVWMQYPDGPVSGVPGMNAIDERLRPPFTPWGKARFDAAKPMQGPTAVPARRMLQPCTVTRTVLREFSI